MDLMNIAGKAVQKIYDNKEKILLGLGFGLGAATVVSAGVGTLKAKKVIEAHNEIKDMIDEATEYSEEYRESEDRKYDVVHMYSQTAAGMAKAYAPTLILGAGATCCFLAQYKLMDEKVCKLEETVASLSAAYAAINTAFKKYRKRVVDKYGEEVDKEMRYGVKTDTVSTTTSEPGEKPKTKKEKVKTVDDLEPSDYAKFFDATSSQFIFQDPNCYKADWDANIRFLNCQQSFANKKLETDGYLFLNDVYEMLGIPKTKAGQVVGWIYDPENPTIDSKVDFGIFEPVNHRTVNGYEEVMLLDFNVDGVIIDKVKDIADH